MDQQKERILTGDNTTGKLHLGHYVGSLRNRVRLIDDYDTFIVLADAHALAYPNYAENPSEIGKFSLEVALDNMAVGVSPEKATYFVDSMVPEIFEIAYLLSAYISYPRNLRNPTLKDEIRDKSLGTNYSMAFLNFPILMAADIISVNANLVPVGEDQLPHLELTREVVRKLNGLVGTSINEPKGLVGDVARLVGTDGGAKMSKSIGNVIMLSDDAETVKQKVKSMYTDPNRLRATDPGKVDGNPVFIYHDAFNTNTEEVADLKERYAKGQVGDVEVKDKLVTALNIFLDPVRERRNTYGKDMEYIRQVIDEGNKKTSEEAKKMLHHIKESLGLLSF